MPDSKISLLNKANQLSGREPLPLVQNGATVRANASSIKSSKSVSLNYVTNIKHEEDVRCMCYTGPDSQYVISGTNPNGRIYRGGTYGDYWDLVCQTGSTGIRSMDTVPDSGVILAGTNDGLLWRSNDWGASFTLESYENFYNMILAIKHIDPTKVLISTNGDIHRSIDSTGNAYMFFLRESQPQATDIWAFAVVNANLIFAASDNDGSNGSIIKSTDMGMTWVDSSLISENNGFVNVIYIPEANVLIAADFDGYFYRSLDQGVTWTEVYQWNDDGDTVAAHSLVHIADGRIIAGSTWTSALMESADYGETWTFLQYQDESTYSIVGFPDQSRALVGSDYYAQIYRVDYKEYAVQPANIFAEYVIENAQRVRLTLDGTTIYDYNFPEVMRSMSPGDLTSQWHWTAKLDNLLGELSPSSHYAKASAESQDVIWSVEWDGDDNNFTWISDGNYLRMWFDGNIFQPQTIIVSAEHRGDMYQGNLKIAHNMSNPYGLGYGFYGYTGHGVL